MRKDILPHSAEAEEAVLGMAMLEPDVVATILDGLKVDDFYDSRHMKIAKSIFALGTSGAPTDVVSVAGWLEDHDLLSKAGGRMYLNKLMDAVVTTAALEHYIEIIKRKSVLRQLIRAGHRIVELGYDEVSDPDKLLDDAVRIVTAPKDELRGGEIVTMADSIDAYNQSFDGEFGQTSGFTSLDYELFDMAGQVCVPAGMPHMGKTVFALNMLYRQARKGIPVGVVSLEMRNEGVTERFAQMAGHVSRRDLLNDPQKRSKALRSAAVLPIVYGKLAQRRLSNILRTMRMMVHDHGVKSILVDYIQLVTAPSAERRDLEVGDVVRAFLEFAQHYNVSIIAPAQVSRAAMNSESHSRGEPHLWQMKDSAGIEAHADIVLGLWRPSYVGENEIASIEPFKVRILKNRAGLVGRRFDFTFYPLEQRIEEAQEVDAVNF